MSGLIDYTERRGTEFRMVLTGRRRKRRGQIGGARIDIEHQYEYKCQDCGHVGWTRHINIARRWRSTFATDNDLGS